MNHPSNYHHPLYLLTDDNYAAVGAVEITDGGRYIGRDTAGRIIFDRKDYAGGVRAAKSAAPRVVSAAWYGIPTGRPRDRAEMAAGRPCPGCDEPLARGRRYCPACSVVARRDRQRPTFYRP